MFPSFDLRGKGALVTGGSGGIGRTITSALAHFGASVAIAGRDLAKAETVVGEVRAQGGKALAVQCDVVDVGQVTAMVDEVVKAFGGIDILVNCAGTLAGAGPAEQITPEDWGQNIAVNLTGVFNCCQAVGKSMIAQKRKGKIISIASVAALTVGNSFSAYNSSKAGVVSLTRSLAIDWARYGINVNAIAPTFIRTPMIKGMMEDEVIRDFLTKRIALGRLGEPEDVAGAVIFLASSASDFITGHTLVVDGGWAAGQVCPW